MLNLGPLDRLTMNDLFTGIGVLGGAGSGKTSTLALLAIAVMAAQCGIVWMCAKPDEVNLVRRLAKVAGREEDVIVIGRDVDGQITPHRFNPLEYEAGRHGVGTTGLIDYLVHCHEILSRKEGQAARGGSDGDRFWEDQFRRLLRYCIDTAKLAGSPLSVQLLRDIQISGPASRDQLGDDAWAARSECWRHLNEIEARLDQGRVEEVDFDRILHFWTHDYAELDPKPKGTIGVMFASLLDSFYAEEPLRSILTTTSTVTPDDVIDHGKIVVLSLPTSIYGKAGRMAQFCFKYSFQRRMIARDKPDDGSFIRPTALWVDEAHQFAHSYDAEYFAEVRSNRGINVFLEQSIGGYMDALGATSAEQVDRYLQGLTTKLFFQNSSPKTNEFASDVIGKRMITRKTDGVEQPRRQRQRERQRDRDRALPSPARRVQHPAARRRGEQ